MPITFLRKKKCMQENFLLVSNKFDINNFKNYIESNIQKIYYKKSSLTKQQIIDYCSQFTLTVKEFFPDKNQSTTSEKLRNAFGTSIKDKPAAVAINSYLLFNFGYICCNTCKDVLPITSFYKTSNSWTGYKHYCIACQKELRDNEHSSLYIKANRAKYNAYLAKYRAAKLRATPPWLTKHHLYLIEKIYKEAYDKNLEVDHIVPLQGSNVCGLHVPWNLQLLTRQENASKSNKLG